MRRGCAAGGRCPGGFAIATTPLPLSEVERAWSLDDSRKRTVFTLGG